MLNAGDDRGYWPISGAATTLRQQRLPIARPYMCAAEPAVESPPRALVQQKVAPPRRHTFGLVQK